MSMQQSHTGPLSLISCVSARESSPVDDVIESKSETKKKRFHPFRNLRRMFRRKSRQLDVADIADAAVLQERGCRVLDPRSCSTGRLIDDETAQARRRSGSLAPGLSLSHDSVFKPDRTDSGHSSSDLENSSLSIPILIPTARFQAELADVVRRRVRDDSDDEDLGLPRSRCSSLATDYPDKLGDRAGKSQSSCSEGSLLSAGSSLEDDLHDEDSDLDLRVTRHKLSHSAAKHKMAVRPRRNHAPASKRAHPKTGSSLPVTPEVNEEASTSWTAAVANPSPESAKASLDIPKTPQPSKTLTTTVVRVDVPNVKSEILKVSPDARPGTTVTSNVQVSRTPLTSLGSWSSGTSSPESGAPVSLVALAPLRSETWSKSASLPHGAALSAEAKVARSLSNAAALKAAAVGDEPTETLFGKHQGSRKKEDEPKEEKPRSSLVRSFSRTSKEKDIVEESSRSLIAKSISRSSTSCDDQENEGAKNLTRLPGKEETSEADTCRPVLSKSLTRGADRRQRVDPIDIPAPVVSSLVRVDPIEIPASAGLSRMRVSYSTSPPTPTWPASLARSTSPPKAVWPERAGIFIKNEPRMRRDSRDSKPPIQKSHSFHKDVPAPVYNHGSSLPKNLSDEDSNRRLYLKNRSLGKPVRKEEKETINGKLTKKSASLESIGSEDLSLRTILPRKSGRSASSDSVRSVVLTHEEPQYANLKNFHLANFDHVHHGYENIEIIELVKKERSEKSPATERKDLTQLPREKLPEPEITRTSIEVSDLPEKPKAPTEQPSLVPEFMRIQLKEPKTGTLVERRKSELQMNEESDGGKLPRAFKKQNSLVEMSSPQKEEIRFKKQVSVLDAVPAKNLLYAKPGDNVVIVEKQPQQVEEVVLRRKSQSGNCDEPELMKVFARRSLKVKDDDKDGDDSESSRSRDSDKENEVAESPKEERKKVEEIRSPVVALKPAAPLKPSIPARNSVLNKYARSLSENIHPVDDAKSIADLKNKLNGTDKSTLTKRPTNVIIKDVAKDTRIDKSLEVEIKKIETKQVVLEKIMDCEKPQVEKVEMVEEIVDGPGFKRIQDRKAEWEKRLQAANH